MVDSSTFGEYYYRHDCGLPYERSEHWLTFFRGIADHIVRELRPSSVLDAGCAIALLVEALRDQGVDAHGLDVSEWAIEQAPEELREHLWVASLTEPIERRYDLITCIEVVEHMPATEARVAIANMCAVTDRLLLSTSPVDFAEPTHLNVQPPEYWSALLASNGFVRNLDYDASYLTPWAALYERSSAPVPEVVRGYDRAWWRLRSEVDELRAKILGMQSQLEQSDERQQADTDDAAATVATVEDRADAAEAKANAAEAQVAAAASEAEQLRQAQLELREEILRLRDLVAGGESELGVMRGRVAELTAMLEHYQQADGRLRAVLASRSWRAMWIAGTPVRKLRGRR